MMDRQLTLGDCKPGQIVKLLKYTDLKASVPLMVTRGGPVCTLCDPFSSYFNVIVRHAPCRLATQDELDQLAERIKRAND